MRVCAVQTDTVWEDKQANMALCRSFYEQAAGCALVVFPELSLTGFSQELSLCEDAGGGTVGFFRELTRGSESAVCFGYGAREGGRLFNRMCVCAHGDVVAQYDKLHPFAIGGEAFSAGERAVCADIAGVRAGLTICYDLRFPELYQRLSRECGVIVCAANWPASRRAQLDALARARAIETQSFVILCNRTGTGGGVVYDGGTAVYSPLGETVAAAQGASQQAVFAEIDPRDAFAARAAFPVAADRRTELYRSFYE